MAGASEIRQLPGFYSSPLGIKLSYQLKKFFLSKKLIPRGKVSVESCSHLDFYPCYSFTAALQRQKFTLLNRSKEFKEKINWNFKGFGMLWNISFNSFDFLCSESTTKEDGLNAIRSFIRSSRDNKSFFDSHCISQRIINCIKFASRNKIEDPLINEFIYGQCLYLRKNPEFHQRNHHILDNGFALLFAAMYFRRQEFFDFSEKLLCANIPIQILPDGAHVELSPMYHLHVLHRMLDAVHLMNRSDYNSNRLMKTLKAVIPKMLGWIRQMQLANGNLPAFNESAEGLMQESRAVLRMAAALKSEVALVPLKESGFRKLKNRNFEMIVDVNGFVQSGIFNHYHDDTFHFILNVFGDPFIVDTGVSTYTKGKETTYERSPMAHNTVTLPRFKRKFRLNPGKLSKVIHLNEMGNEIEATHDGYSHLGVMHTRKITMKSDCIEITDSVRSTRPGKPVKCNAYLHIDKKSGLKRKDNKFVSRFTTIEFMNHSSLSLQEGWHSPTFGRRSSCFVINAGFQNEFVTRISVNKNPSG